MPRKKIPDGCAWQPVLTLELACIAGPNASGVGLLVSGSAADRVVERWWPGIQGRINESQLLDLETVMLNHVHDALLYWTGVQKVLPLA